MPILTKMRELLPELSKSERKVADYLLKYPFDVRRFSCEAVAENCKTSRSAVIRLCQKLGLRGYSELRYAIENEPLEEFSPLSGEPGQNVLHFYSDVISQLQPLSGSEQLLSLVDTILYSNRIITLGNSHSGLSASQLSFRLNRFHIDCYSITDMAVAESYARILKQGDTVIILSISGAKLYEDIVSDFRKNRVKVVLITMTPSSSLIQMADQTILLPLVSHAASRYLLDDAVTFFLFTELLIEELNARLAERNS